MLLFFTRGTNVRSLADINFRVDFIFSVFVEIFTTSCRNVNLMCPNKFFVLQWIPANIGLTCNEKVDRSIVTIIAVCHTSDSNIKNVLSFGRKIWTRELFPRAFGIKQYSRAYPAIFGLMEQT